MARRLSLVLASALLLSACAGVLDGTFQDITLKTPGTDQAHCTMNNHIMNYQVYSNQTIRVQRNDRDLEIFCRAPGNKEVSVLIDRDLNAWALADVFTGIVPGVAYDHFSGALYDYPDVITIDFASVPSRPMDAPQYEAAEAPKLKMQGIENYDPSIVKKDGDKYYVRALPRKMDMNELRGRSHPLGSDGAAPPPAQ
jgi:hypothetical protein